jgi:hypothetical protein
MDQLSSAELLVLAQALVPVVAVVVVEAVVQLLLQLEGLTNMQNQHKY